MEALAMDTVNPNLLKSVAIIHEVAVAYIFLSCVVPPPPSGSWPAPISCCNLLAEYMITSSVLES